MVRQLQWWEAAMDWWNPRLQMTNVRFPSL